MSIVLSRLCRPGQPRLEVVLVTSDAEREQVFRLRYDIYVAERGTISADHPYVQDGQRLIDAYDRWSSNLLLLADGEPIGTARLTEARDGPLEVEEYLDASALPWSREQVAEGTRFMVRADWRGTVAGALIAQACYRLLAQSRASVLLTAGKLGKLGRYYKNAGYAPVEGVEPFTYGLTGCRYELLAVDLGAAGSLRRALWGARAWLQGLVAFRITALSRLLFRRGFSTSSPAAA